MKPPLLILIVIFLCALSPREAEFKKSLGKPMKKKAVRVSSPFPVLAIAPPPLRMVTNTLHLKCDPSPDENVSGYKFYAGTNSGNYNVSQDTGMETECDLTFIFVKTNRPARWFFNVTCYNAAGEESALINEVHWPTFPRILAGFVLSWPDWMTVDVQESAYLGNWIALATVTGTNYQFNINQLSIDSCCFRLLQTNGPPQPLTIAAITIPDPRDVPPAPPPGRN